MITPELYVTDLEASLAFYGALGFSILYRRRDKAFARLARRSAEIMLEEPRGRTWLLAPLSHPRGIGINLTIATEAVNELFLSVPRSAHVILPLETKSYARQDDTITIRQYVVADPDGYLLRFSETLGVTLTRPPATP